MQPSTLSQEELVEFARIIYGDPWREELAKHLNISRKKLVLTLASDDPVPSEIVVPFLSLVENHLQKQEALTIRLEKRVKEIRGTSNRNSQSRVARRTAS